MNFNQLRKTFLSQTAGASCGLNVAANRLKIPEIIHLL